MAWPPSNAYVFHHETLQAREPGTLLTHCQQYWLLCNSLERFSIKFLLTKSTLLNYSETTLITEGRGVI